jgi:hypothetical protein
MAEKQQQGWGQNPTSSGGKKRDVPYVPFAGSKVNVFIPLSNITYHLSIVRVNGWDQPVEMWTHDIYANGRYMMNVFCKNTSINDQTCIFDNANNAKQAEMGVTLENKQRPFPLKKKYVFPIMVDEIPELPYLFCKISEKQMKAIVTQFQMSNAGEDVKIQLMRTGTKMQDTVYTYAITADPVNKDAINKCGIMTVTPEDYKQKLVALEDLSKLDFINFDDITSNPQSPAPQLQADQSQQNQNTDSALQPQPQSLPPQNPPQPDNNAPASNTDMVEKAKNYEIDFGPYAGKKMGELAPNILTILVNNLTGEVQELAKALLEASK